MLDTPPEIFCFQLNKLTFFYSVMVHGELRKQECIPVGCVPPAAVPVFFGGGGVCLSAFWDTHTPLVVGLGTPPPGVGLETPTARHPILPGSGPEDLPPSQTPNLPLGVGLETPPLPDSSSSPWVWAWKPARHAGMPPPVPGDLQGMLGYHLPVNRIIDTCKNITLPQLRCGR